MKLNDYLKAINHTKETLLDTDDELVEKGYAPFVWCRFKVGAGRSL